MHFKKSLLVVLTLAMTAPVMAKVVVGKVDIQKILVSTNEGKKVREKLKKEYESKQKILKGDEDKIKKMKTDYDKQSAVLNAKARGKKERELQESIMKLQQKTMQYQQEIQQKEQELKKPLLDKIKGIVEAVSKKSDVDFTVEVSTSPVVYAKESKDLTDEVIKEYNKKNK